VYAIKVMKKSEMVNKNMASQGNCITRCCMSFFMCYLTVFFYQDCMSLDSRMIDIWWFGRKWLCPHWGTIPAFPWRDRGRPLTSVRIARIQTEHLPDTSPELCHYTFLFSGCCSDWDILSLTEGFINIPLFLQHDEVW
jgi:hypothetical protein